MVGMRDVANAAGVSLSTVSLVVNGSGYVSDAMREKVLKTISDMGYEPRKHVRSAARCGMVGVIVPTLRHPFFASLISEIAKQLAVIDEIPLILGTNEYAGADGICADMLRHRKLDGIIVCSHTSGTADELSAINAPIVAFDRYLHPSIPVVNSDHMQGAHLVAELLVGTGVQRVIEMGGPRSQFHDIPIDEEGNDTSFPTTHYHRTLEEELAKNGVRVEYMQVSDVSDMSLFRKVAAAAFEKQEKVDAIVAPDMAAAYSVQQALLRGIEIPKQLQVVAYDGTIVTDMAGMRITAVRQNVGAIARGLVTTLNQEIERGGKLRDRKVEHKLVPVRLVTGDTTR